MYNLTLIIPTHNRHKYLKRSIEYFKDLNAKVIYCDSSEEAYSSYLASNMEYIHLPEKKFAEKILIALKKTDSDFVALCADDDFILIDSLYNGASFLINNDSFKTVIGQNIAFHERFEGQYYFKAKATDLNEINSDPYTNCISFFKNYQQILWGLYHKEILINTFQIIKEANFNNENFIELVLGGIACYSGGIKILDEVWSIRELSAKEHWGDKHKVISIEYLYSNGNDSKLFKDKLDRHTTNGYAKLVLINYLKLTKVKKYKILIKEIIKHILLFLLRPVKLSAKMREYNNSFEKYPGLQKYFIPDKLKLQLNKISTTIERNCE